MSLVTVTAMSLKDVEFGGHVSFPHTLRGGGDPTQVKALNKLLP